MHKRLLIALLFFISGFLSAQDSTIVKKASTKGLGLSFGFLYGQLYSTGTAAFDTTTARVMKQEAVSRPGFSAALLYEFGKSRIHHRMGVEAQFIYTYLSYDKKDNYVFEAFIHPVTVNIPFTTTYTFKTKRPLGIGCGPTLSVPLNQFSSTRPANSPINIYADFFLSHSIPAGKNTMHLELGYAIGLLNMIDSSAQDQYTNVVDKVKRNVLSIKLYFN